MENNNEPSATEVAGISADGIIDAIAIITACICRHAVITDAVVTDIHLLLEKYHRSNEISPRRAISQHALQAVLQLLKLQTLGQK